MVALCCLSRVSLLRGQAAHNPNITKLAVTPGRGYDKFHLSGEDTNYLPQWMGSAGYRSEYLGKLMNQYGTYNYQFTSKGWDHFDGFIEPYTYIYNLTIFAINGARPTYYPNYHQTDVLRAKASRRSLGNFVGDRRASFLTVSTMAPHQQFNGTFDLYPGLQAPRSPNFNPKVQKKPSWVGQLPFMDDRSIEFSDETYRRRAQALKGVDEMIDNLLDILDQSGKPNNTYVVFTSDYGYHLGNHRMVAGKEVPYREVPFMIRSPSIAKGVSILPSNHVDMAPTFLDLAQLDKSSFPELLDGRSLLPYWTDLESASVNLTDTINIEFWGTGALEVTWATPLNIGNSYKTLRIIGKDYGYLYGHWGYQRNRALRYQVEPLGSVAKCQFGEQAQRCSARHQNLRKGFMCRDPWKTLHPDGSVHNLGQALDAQHDAYYASLPVVAFKECLQYHNIYRDKAATGFATSSAALAIVPENGHWGSVYVDLARMEKTARALTDAELGV
ncbi:arylsulfatase [Mycena floridula]|nr:arylsulfatase [Mycena floridula]